MATVTTAIEYMSKNINYSNGKLLEWNFLSKTLGHIVFIIQQHMDDKTDDFKKEFILRCATLDTDLYNDDKHFKTVYTHKVTYTKNKEGAMSILLQNINDICNEDFRFCKLSSWIYLDGDTYEDDKERMEDVCKKMIMAKVDNCCVCLDPTTLELSCCSGYICRLCYVKTTELKYSCCIEQELEVFKCPLCRNITGYCCTDDTW